MRLVSADNVIGAMAYWAVSVHPYQRPEGLFDVCDVITSTADAQWKDGAPGRPMRWFDDEIAIANWLRETLFSSPAAKPIITAWNTPRSGHTRPFVVIHRFTALPREDSFIDVSSLCFDVARYAWREAREFERPAAVA